jgi:hypothetical protein
MIFDAGDMVDDAMMAQMSGKSGFIGALDQSGGSTPGASLTKAADRPTYVKVRAEILGDGRPAFMLQVVTELIRPGMLVEVEVIAAKA